MYSATSTLVHSTSWPVSPVARARSMATPITTGTADSPTCHTIAATIAGTVMRGTEKITWLRNRPDVVVASMSYGSTAGGLGAAWRITGSHRVSGPRPN